MHGPGEEPSTSPGPEVMSSTSSRLSMVEEESLQVLEWPAVCRQVGSGSHEAMSIGTLAATFLF